MRADIFLVVLLVASVCAVPNVTLLGSFDHQADESSPLVWHGKLVIMETLPGYNPEHQSFCVTDYFIVRDLASWQIIATIPSSCHHAFGSATVTTDENGIETMWVFGTRWERDDLRSNRRTGIRPMWGGPCGEGMCGVDVFWSTDLKTWKNASAVDFPKGVQVFNTDVTYVAQAPATLPKHNWIMAIEESYPGVGYRILFYVKNGTTLDQDAWVALDPAKYFIPNFNTGGNQIGACPSIRFIPETGYYYVTTGGQKIWVVRSKDLVNWEQGHYNKGALITPTSADCFFMSKKWTGWNPSQATITLMGQCSKWDTCVSDSDLTEYKMADGTIATVFLYQPNDQAGTGFSNLLIHYGDYNSFFSSYFM